jgi:hypothetical protein
MNKKGIEQEDTERTEKRAFFLSVLSVSSCSDF